MFAFRLNFNLPFTWIKSVATSNYDFFLFHLQSSLSSAETDIYFFDDQHRICISAWCVIKVRRNLVFNKKFRVIYNYLKQKLTLGAP